MSDARDVINKAISEHHDIKETVDLSKDSLTDIEALFALRQAYSSWTQCAPEDLKARQEQLLQVVNAVDRGLRGHWGFEEKAVKPLFGDALMKGFVGEHGEIVRRMEAARKTLTEVKLAGLEQQELLTRKTVIQEAVNYALQAIEEHTNHEEMLFKMMKKGTDARS